jgi:DNA-binding transcriptional ArsR family regulator
MLQARFDTEALTRVRFGISPMLELSASLRVLRKPAENALHLPWMEQARPQLEGLDLSVLVALQSAPSYNPDFINPPPSDPLVEFEDELAVMLAIAPSQIREEVHASFPQLPPLLEPFVTDPRRAVAELAELMRAYWHRCLAAHWPRIRSLLEHDVLYRARQMADGGTRRLFGDIDPNVGWEDGVLQVELLCQEMNRMLELDERGLLLVPSAFLWDKVTAVVAEPWQPTLVYPARGIGMLWDPERLAPPEALERLLGRTRASLLIAVDSPHSTTELAGALGLTPGGVSQHLAVLRDAGLVHGRRVARSVLYLRSCQGDELVRAAVPAQDTESARTAAGIG